MAGLHLSCCLVVMRLKTRKKRRLKKLRVFLKLKKIAFIAKKDDGESDLPSTLEDPRLIKLATVNTEQMVEEINGEERGRFATLAGATLVTGGNWRAADECMALIERRISLLKAISNI